MKTKFVLTTITASILSIVTSQASADGYQKFGGYFRAASVADKNGQVLMDRANWGRLGTQLSNYMQVDLIRGWNLENGQSINIVFQGTAYDNNSVTTASQTGGTTDLTASQTFVELGGAVFGGDEILWGGTRVYNRFEVYNHITDTFHADVNGTGIGLQNLKFGDTRMDIAWVTAGSSVPLDETYNSTDEAFSQNVHLGISNGKVRSDIIIGHVEDYEDNDRETRTTTLIGAYKHDKFYFAGEGNSNFMVKYEDNVFNDEDSELELETFGQFNKGNFMLANSLNYFIYDGGDPNKVWSRTVLNATLRPIFITPNIPLGALVFEFGMTQTTPSEDDDITSVQEGTDYKAVMAPTWSVASGEGPQPEIRLIVGMEDGDTIQPRNWAGTQVEMWW